MLKTPQRLLKTRCGNVEKGDKTDKHDDLSKVFITFVRKFGVPMLKKRGVEIGNNFINIR